MSPTAVRTTDFLDRLAADLQTLRAITSREFRSLTDEQLNRRPSPGKWSVGQCLEHLNIVGGHYLPSIALRLRRAKDRGTRPTETVKFGPIGRKLVESMRADATTKPQKAPQKFAPSGSRLPRTVVEVFSRQLDELVSLIEQTREVNANNIRIPNVIIPLVFLRLPDQLELLTVHIQRHVAQAERVLASTVRPASARGDE
ncbi:DinB family protein [Hymenobacter crusticola]|uniref:DinB-like domain-containing protein n=1 Tax=Hymenobacter crusticola TaxID=1770526 RepID=A0A243WHT8_9BACT|nr:DinB family protein [Hymenobacter crusticola]OUJ75379.1 hypothetical protein BXP70_05025 [Hymenobacter crusticola]